MRLQNLWNLIIFLSPHVSTHAQLVCSSCSAVLWNYLPTDGSEGTAWFTCICDLLWQRYIIHIGDPDVNPWICHAVKKALYTCHFLCTPKYTPLPAWLQTLLRWMLVMFYSHASILCGLCMLTSPVSWLQLKPATVQLMVNYWRST